MSTEPAFLNALITTELAAVADERVVGAISSLLVEPRAGLIDWDYGSPNQQFNCWTVFHDRLNNTEIVFCEEGFGPSMPWGLVPADAGDGRRSMGMDSGWFETFLEAWFDSFSATDLDVWRVFETDAAGLSRAVTAELAWDAAWLRRDELASSNMDAQYHVDSPLRPRASCH